MYQNKTIQYVEMGDLTVAHKRHQKSTSKFTTNNINIKIINNNNNNNNNVDSKLNLKNLVVKKEGLVSNTL